MLSSLLYLAASAVASPLFHPTNEIPLTQDFRIPTVHESAVQGRRMLHLESLGTLSTVFPSDDDAEIAENRPFSVQGTSIGLMEYFADCEPETGNPTLLAVDIANNFKNAKAGSNTTLSIRWHPPKLNKYSAAALPRFALIGTLEDMTKEEIESKDIQNCFLRYHPDARIWVPGNDIHTSRWTRLVVHEIYWFGGFGDRARIQWLPIEEWKNVTFEEIDNCRLPGEPKEDADGFN